jgi:hypothetical protein
MNLSWLALALSVLATFPQLFKTITTGSAQDYHIGAMFLSVFANLVLATHGYYTSDIGVFLMGLWFALYYAVLSYYKIGGSEKPDE